MARNWSAVKSTFTNIAVASSLKPKRRTFKNKKENEEEPMPELDGTSKELDEKAHFTDDDEEVPAATQAFGVDSDNDKELTGGKATKKKIKSKGKSKGTAEKYNASEDEEEMTDTTEEVGAAPAYASFGLDDPSNHANPTDHSRLSGDNDSDDSAKILIPQEFGSDDVLEQVSTNPSTTVKTEASKKRSKSNKKGKKLKSSEMSDENDKRSGTKRNIHANKQADVLHEEEKYICKTLGMDTFKFFCLRHPDQEITALKPSYEPVLQCPLCQSELDTDRDRMEKHRERVKTAMESVHNIIQESEDWKERTQIANWHSNSQINLLSGVSDEGKEENLSEREWLDQVVERMLQVQAWKTLGKQPLRNHPDYARYFRLFRIGVPLDAVKFTAERDGFDPTVLDLSPDLPLESQRPVEPHGRAESESEDISRPISTSDIDGQENKPTTEILVIIQIAFNRLRAKDLLQAATLATLKRTEERRDKNRNGGPKKTRKSSIGRRKRGEKKKNRAEKTVRRTTRTGMAEEPNKDEKDLVIRKLKDELAKKDMEIESLHEKVHEMEQHINVNSSSHRSLGSMASDGGKPLTDSELRDTTKANSGKGNDSATKSDDAFNEALEFAVAHISDNAITEKGSNTHHSITEKDKAIAHDLALGPGSDNSGKEEVSNSIDGEHSFGSSSNALDIMASLSRKDVVTSKDGEDVERHGNVCASTKDEHSSSSSFGKRFDLGATDDDATGSQASLVVKERPGTESDEKEETSDSFDNEYNLSDLKIQGSEDLINGSVSSKNDLHNTEDAPSSSDSEYTSGSCDAMNEEAVSSDARTGNDEHVNPVASSEEDDNILELAVSVHEKAGKDQGERADGSFYGKYTDQPLALDVAGPNSAALPLAASTGDDIDAIGSEDDDNDDFDLELAASLHTSKDEVSLGSFDDEYDSVASLQDNVAALKNTPDAVRDIDDTATELTTALHTSQQVNTVMSQQPEYLSSDGGNASGLFNSEPSKSEDEAKDDSEQADGLFTAVPNEKFGRDAGNADEATLDLAASLHSAIDKATEQDTMQDSFVDEFNAESSSSDEKEEEAFADEYTPDLNALETNSSDDEVNVLENALDLAAAVHSEKTNSAASGSSADASYTSSATETRDAEGGYGDMESQVSDQGQFNDEAVSAVIKSADSGVDSDDAVLDLAASLHNNETNPGMQMQLEVQPEPMPLAKMELLTHHNDDSSDNDDGDDDELMMAAALLAREDDSSIGDRGNIAGYDDELQALQAYQQAEGLFYDGAGTAPYTDDPPVLLDAASESSYEPASSDDEGGAVLSSAWKHSDGEIDGHDDDDNDSYESYGSYESDPDDNGSSKELV